MKPVEKRPKASHKEEEWMEVPNKKDLRKKKVKKPTRAPEKPRRPRPEAVLIKPAEAMRYASILRKLKKRVNPDELGAIFQGIRKTHSKDLLVELKCSTKSRRRLDTASKEAIGARGMVRHHIPRIDVEIPDLEPTIGLLKAAHIKIGWVSCRVRRKKEVNRCFRGRLLRVRPKRSCWRWGEGSCCGFLHWEAAVLPLCRKNG